MQTNSEIEITATPSSVPEVCKFTLNMTLNDNTSIYCKSKSSAKDSLLLKELFAIEGVEEVLVNSNQLTIKKNGDKSWEELAPIIGPKIRKMVNSGEKLFHSADTSTITANDHQDEFNLVKKVLEEEIAPMLASHGGFVELVNIKDHIVYINFGGGCQGCASASATVKNGIEKMLMERVPSVIEVRDQTDHAQGSNPYC